MDPPPLNTFLKLSKYDHLPVKQNIIPKTQNNFIIQFHNRFLLYDVYRAYNKNKGYHKIKNSGIK